MYSVEGALQSLDSVGNECDTFRGDLRDRRREGKGKGAEKPKAYFKATIQSEANAIQRIETDRTDEEKANER
jgi:hypothetical protein